jgi:mannose/fructose/N-acetylgalactosamine-specific phosphotransferase system component IIB
MRKILSLLAVLIVIALPALSQTRKITGKVTDAKGIPIPFATIKIKGKNVGSAADQNGTFIIEAAATDVLLISAAGYDLQEITVGNQQSINAGLQSNTHLDEVIVTAQGIRRRPKELGYSVARVTSEDITVGRSPQIAQSLSGKVSGLAI